MLYVLASHIESASHLVLLPRPGRTMLTAAQCITYTGGGAFPETLRRVVAYCRQANDQGEADRE